MNRLGERAGFIHGIGSRWAWSWRKRDMRTNIAERMGNDAADICAKSKNFEIFSDGSWHDFFHVSGPFLQVGSAIALALHKAPNLCKNGLHIEGHNPTARDDQL